MVRMQRRRRFPFRLWKGLRLNGLDKIFARIEGKDYIPVVPIYESTFLGDCIHLPKGEAEAIVAKETIWEFDEYKLKNSID